MTEIASMALSAVGAQIVVAIFGLTLILKLYLRRKLGKLPDEFILVPWILGLGAGFAQYYGNTNVHLDPAVTMLMHFYRASFLGMLYAGGAVIINESGVLFKLVKPKDQVDDAMPKHPGEEGTGADVPK